MMMVDECVEVEVDEKRNGFFEEVAEESCLEWVCLIDER
jgi:hypothetical protein